MLLEWKRGLIYQLGGPLDSLAEAVPWPVEEPILPTSSQIEGQIHVSCVREVSFSKLRTCHPETVVVIYVPARHLGAAKDGVMHEF
jgi:hypothetical protein